MTPKRTEATPNERSSIIPALAGAMLLIGLVMGLAVEHQNRLQLGEEQLALQQQLDRVGELIAANERQARLTATGNPAPAGDFAGELLRLRAELSALRQLTNELDRAQKENAEAHAALDRYLTNATTPKVATADYWPKDSWKFTGFATPDDSLRSFLWASDNGNMKTLLDSTTGVFRQTVEKENEGKSADEAAIRAMDEMSKLKSIQVLSRDFQSEDTARFTVTFEDGDQTHTTPLDFKKVGNEWKVSGINE